ncbi:MAG: hypothetical protein AAF604_04635 [Acidobacteriota bacterium]
MIHPLHLRRAIWDALRQMGSKFATDAALQLLLLIAAHESRAGRYLWQVDADGKPRGPALGIFQMEAATHRDLWLNYVRWKPDYHAILAMALGRNGGTLEDLIAIGERALPVNLRYATTVARLQLWRHPKPLPAPADIEGLARYWHAAWCKGCAGTVEEAIANYRRYVL